MRTHPGSRRAQTVAAAVRSLHPTITGPSGPGWKEASCPLEPRSAGCVDGSSLPAAGNHVRPYHTNPRNRPSFYQQYPNGQVTPIVQTVTKSTDTGFAWGDAGIGAAFAAVAAGLLGAAIQATRTRRSLATRDPSTRGAA